MTRFLRALVEESGETPVAQEGEPIRFVASTGGVKRDGLDLDQERWMLGNYRANPVVLWVHDYFGERMPIGRAEVSIGEGALIADVTFDQEDAFAREVESKYRRGFMNAVSVGWDTVAADESGAWVPVRSLGRTVDEEEMRFDLLDISAVPVPGDPGALMERERAGWRSVRGAVDEVLGEARSGDRPEQGERDLEIAATDGDELGQVAKGRAGPGDPAVAEGIRRLYEMVFPKGAG